MAQGITTEIEDSDIYLAFNEYDFDNDKRFQDGFRKISSREKTPEDEEVLRAKVFYFNKFHRPVTSHTSVDVDGFKKWLQTMQQKGCHTPEGSCDTESATEGMSPTDGKDDSAFNTAAGDGETVSSIEAPGHPRYPTSFSDIIQYVQEGKEIPGIEKLNVQPTNSEPTLSSQTRPPKPWE